MNGIRKHPVGGALSGLALGLGVLVMLLVYGFAWFQDWWPYAIILVLFIAAGVLVGLYAPPWRGRG
jgi:multisubunit Na+/H+ antiporter MnhB subunit